MNQNFVKFNSLAILSLLIVGCNNTSISENTSDKTSNATLNLVANGEDFVRQGFVTKDGWQINFDHLDVNLSDVTAYQMEGVFDVTENNKIDTLQYKKKVSLLDQAKVVDLAQGEADAEPVMVTNQQVSPGFYNAISWKIDTAAADSPIAGKTMVLQGTASKDDQIINFNISLNRPIQYLCGEYVGDERKGIVQAADTGELETTFHFDHVFGDNEISAEETLNVDALGFEPLAKLASGDRLIVDETTISQQLSPQDQEKLTKAVIGLGHVGEGHCALIQ